MTRNTANIGWFDWVMFCDNKPSYPDYKKPLGCYLGPALDKGLAMMAKIFKSNIKRGTCLQIDPATPYWQSAQ